MAVQKPKHPRVFPAAMPTPSHTSLSLCCSSGCTCIRCFVQACLDKPSGGLCVHQRRKRSLSDLLYLSHFHESSARCGRWGSFMLLCLHPQHAKLWPIGTPTQWPLMHSDLLSTRAESRIALARHDHPGHPLWQTTAFFLLAKPCRPPATKSLTWQPWRGSRGHNRTA